MSAGEEAAFVYGSDARKTYISFTTVVLLPIGIGFAAGVYFGLIAMAFLWPMGIDLRYAAIPASIAAALGWYATLRWVYAMVKDLEEAMQAITRGKLESERIIRVETYSDERRTIQRATLGVTYEQLALVARRVVAGGTLSIGNMLPIFNGSRSAFQDFQTRLVAAGWARWRNPAAPTQGMEVTEQGLNEFRRIVDANIPPPTRDSLSSRVGGLAVTHTDTHENYE